ncbi:MAG: hypothetical protein RL119_1494 [Actinomycetota bacterium]|jgi:uncharacterized membrane protein YhhN
MLFGVAMGLVALDWIAVIGQSKVLEYFCKPAAALAFFATTLILEPASDTARLWVSAALLLCLIGDVFLMLPRDAFLLGLASFAVAQILFTAGFASLNPTPLRLLIAVVVVLPGAAILARRFLRALKTQGAFSMAPAIVVYVIVIAAMVVSSIAGGSAVGVAGAVLFLISDSLIAEQRFVSSRRWQPLTIIITYHLALAGLVLGLV